MRCHIHVDERLLMLDSYEKPSEKEMDRLDFLDNATENSRLCC